MKYDIIFSIGFNCKVAQHLKDKGLRECAYPLDWQICRNFEKIINLFETDFQDFFDVYQEELDEKSLPGLRTVKDTKNEIVSMHHIISDIPLEAAVDDFRNLMIKRYFRLKEHLREANSILIFSNYNVSIDKLISFLERFSKLYLNKKIVLVNVANSDSEGKNYYHINHNLVLIEYLIDDVNEDGPDSEANPSFWLGNKKKWYEIIDEVCYN